MNVRRKVSGAAVAGLMLIPVLTLAQVGPGQGPGMPSETAPSGGSMMMQMMGTGMMGGMGPGAGGQPTTLTPLISPGNPAMSTFIGLAGHSLRTISASRFRGSS